MELDTAKNCYLRVDKKMAKINTDEYFSGIARTGARGNRYLLILIFICHFNIMLILS